MSIRYFAVAGVLLAGCTKVTTSGNSSGSSSATSAVAGSTTSGSGSGPTTSSTSSSGSHSAASTSGSGSHGASSTGTSAASNTSGGSLGGTTGAGLGPSIDALVGINGFIDDPKDKLESFGTVREYHNWSWTDGNGAAGYPGYPNNQLQFSLWSGFWDFDDYYTQLVSHGVLVLPCIQGSVSYLNNALPPVPSGSSDQDPASYVAHASLMFQYAARYGAVAVAASQLKLDSSQTVVSGLNLIQYYENANEPDNNWTHSDGSHLYSAEAIAAQSSADYDGDQGRLGPGFGVKAADPNAKLVLSGLAMAGPSDPVTNAIDYLEGIRAWATAHRGGSFPADVLNFHYYCFGPDGFGVPNPRPAKSPEDCGLTALLGQLVAYRDQHLPGMPVWLTEFGYDTDPNSNLRAPPIGASTQEQVQGQWLVRSILAIAESGFDRATLFVSRDGCSDGDSNCTSQNIQFSTSGVLTEPSNSSTGFTQRAKPAYYYLAAFRHALAGLSFAGTRSSGNAGVRVDAFADATGRGAYVVWSPTSTGATVSGYSLSVPSATSAMKVELVDQSATGQSSALTIASDAVALDVSETPVIVQVDHVQ